MNKKYTFAYLLIILAGILGFVLYAVRGSTFAVLDPKGIIALQERNLILGAALLMLLVVVPVFVLTFVIAWRYRAGNTNARYTPDWEHDRIEEFIWWTVPALIIAVLAALTWTSSHELDPFKPISSDAKPLTIQVVALNWKWLFIYPDQHIAPLHFVEFPAGTPVDFEVTADAPMNSFWIPQLGGQIYAMTGMVTHLNLMADEEGTYSGSSANFSGAGFSGMQFAAEAVSPKDFNTWVRRTQHAPQTLDAGVYAQLRKPSENNAPAYYSSTADTLFSTIVSNFMGPMNMGAGDDMNSIPSMAGMHM